MPEEVGTIMPTEGASEVVETTPNEGLETTESTESLESGVEESTGQEQTGEIQEKGKPQPKARQVIDKYLKSEEYKQLKEANPQLAKAINSAHRVLVETDTMLQPFGGLPGLRKIVESLDMAGGLDAIPQMAERLQEYDSTDEGLMAGDPQVVMGVIEQFPALMNGQAVPMVLDKYAQANPEGFDQLKAKLLTDEIYQRGHVYDYLVDAYKALPDTEENKTAKAMLAEIYKWFEKRKQLAGKQPAAVKPEAVSQEKQEIEQERENLAMEKANGPVREYAYPKYVKELAKLGVNLTGQDLEDFKKFTDQKIQAKIGNDATYKRLFFPMLKKRDSAGMEKLAKQYIDKYIVKAVNEVHAERYKGRGRFANIKQQIVKPKTAPTTAAKPAAVAAQRPAVVARVPKVGNAPGDIDRRRTSAKMFSQGQAYLNDGRFVTFKRA